MIGASGGGYPAGAAGVVLAAVWGLVCGSFLGAVTWRLPRGQSLWWPPSRCPSCGRRLRPLDLVPLLSFLALRGRCRTCGRPVGWRYPLTEALTAALWAAVAVVAHGRIPALAGGWAVASLAVAAGVTDLETRRIPDALTAAGLVVWAVLQVAAPWHGVGGALAGAAVLGGVPLLAAVLWRGAMGWGDVKLGAVLGLFLGWRLAFVGLELAVLAGAAAGAGLVLLRRRRLGEGIPFGPWLGGGAVAAVLGGMPVVAWYAHWAGLR